MRHHAVLELEEVTRLRVCELLWFVDLRPNLVQITLKDALDPSRVVTSVIKVPQDEK